LQLCDDTLNVLGRAGHNDGIDKGKASAT